MAKTKIGKKKGLPVKVVGKPATPWEPGGGFHVVQVKAFVGRRVKKYVERAFNNVEEAAAYLEEIIGDKKPEYTMDHTYAIIGAMDNVVCNMPIDMVLNKQPIPPEGLRNIISPTPSIVIPGVRNKLPTDMPAPGSTPVSAQKRPPKELRSSPDAENSGSLVHLKQITSDARKARQILRRAVRDQKKYPALYEDHRKNARWAWPADSDALAEAKAALFAGEKK